MRDLLLSAALIALPVGVFAAGYSLIAPAPAAQTQADAGPSLGDMTPFTTIVTDVQATAAKGDLTAAEARITDFETAWDDAQKGLRPINTTAWGNVDTAADAALDALRAKSPDPAKVETTLADLQAELADPSRAPGDTAAATGALTVAGIATTDANGRPLPCEVMLDTFRTTRAGATLTDADVATVDTLQAKGTERCNADDDARADDFFAQGLALMSN